ncbi:MAG TPA: ribonuclease E activity regulator RraA [Candidatus Binatia bacterium]|nr:ribonuclease E activity regulator RraA [Candidatus Binatia bacterium]
MTHPTTDLSDAHPQAQVCDPVFRDFGGQRVFHGPIKTLKVFEDNSLVRAQLEQKGEGRVLVVDGGGSKRCALLGDQLGQLAVKNGWAGILIYGCIRDSEAIGALAVGVKALAVHPRKSEKRGAGQEDVPLQFAGVTFRSGAWLYADADGILVSDKPLHG